MGTSGQSPQCQINLAFTILVGTFGLSLTHSHTHTDTHTVTHTHTHTHTHVGFYGLRGLSIGVMVFILYKLYVLLPYTYPTSKLSPHRRRCISTFPQKTHSVWFISVLNYGDTENVLINHLLLVIPMLYPCHYTNLCPHKPHKHAHTHTHTHTHTCRFLWFTGNLHRRNVFLYCTNCMCYCPTPTLHLNLALTGDFMHFYFPQKNSFCMIYKRFEIWGHWNVTFSF